jgi:hypothetical protein
MVLVFWALFSTKGGLFLRAHPFVCRVYLSAFIQEPCGFARENGVRTVFPPVFAAVSLKIIQDLFAVYFHNL